MPFSNCQEVLLLFSWGEGNSRGGEVPDEADVGCAEAEGDVFCTFPWDAKFIRDGVDVVKVVGVWLIFERPW